MPMRQSVGDDRPPRFLGNPLDGSLGSWTPVRPTRQAVAARRRGPRLCQQRRLPTGKVSRLDVRAFRLAVYASRRRSPAAVQDSLPAAGRLYRMGLDTHRAAMKGFRVVFVTSHPPSPGFACAMTPINPRKLLLESAFGSDARQGGLADVEASQQRQGDDASVGVSGSGP